MELIPLMEKVLQFDDAYEVEEFLKIHFKNLVW
jgi:hypothetical protein